MGKVINQVGLVNVDISVFDDALKTLYSDGVFHGTSNWTVRNLYREISCEISPCTCKDKKYAGRYMPKPRLTIIRIFRLPIETNGYRWEEIAIKGRVKYRIVWAVVWIKTSVYFICSNRLFYLLSISILGRNSHLICFTNDVVKF